MNNKDLDKATPINQQDTPPNKQAKDWQAPELVELDIAEHTKFGAPGPGDGPNPYS